MMADSMEAMSENSEVPTKIPRYKPLHSKIPVLSKSYLSQFKHIKKNKEEIERRRAEIGVLKTDMTATIGNRGSHEVEQHVDVESTSESTLAKGEGMEATISPYIKSEIRTTIVTPKGTKRKVRPSHIRFEAKLDDALTESTTSEEGGSVVVDDLLDRLEQYSFLKALGRKEILKAISKRWKKHVKYRGKGASRKGYYDGIVLSMPQSAIGSKTLEKVIGVEQPIEFASPKRKQKKDSSSGPSCKMQLTYSGGDSSSVENLAQQFEMFEVSNDNILHEADELMSDVGTSNLEKQICNLKAKIVDLDANNKTLSEQLLSVQASFDKYVLLSSEIMSKHEAMIDLYKEIVDSGQMLGGLLSISEKSVITNEINLAKKVFNLGLRDGDTKDLTNILNPLLFEATMEKLRSSCPTIVSMLEQLVLSPNAARNTIKTPNMKMKAAVHLLASLIDVRDQNASNDMPILFGLVCLCFGAGPSMIGLLQRLGLSECYPVLIKILKVQMENYKSLIEMRVEKKNPVVTFQDNMQLMRTSMRHLRLSKLTQDKMKQNKMWDFTVRGWRVADITGIEDMFNDQTSVEPQQAVKDLKYEDFLIKNNPSHEEKWKEFKKRNTLRKMNVALNGVRVSKEQMRNMTAEDLQREASEQNRSMQYSIYVPGIPCEFPDMAEKEAKIYPLPISHENQCTTLGAASNLELFQEEFGFTSNKEKKFLPLQSSGKEFDLDRAYKRFAFLKTLEHHKKGQRDYEQILRGQRGDVNEVAEDEHEGLFLVVDQEDEEDPLSD